MTKYENVQKNVLQFNNNCNQKLPLIIIYLYSYIKNTIKNLFYKLTVPKISR